MRSPIRCRPGARSVAPGSALHTLRDDSSPFGPCPPLTAVVVPAAGDAGTVLVLLEPPFAWPDSSFDAASELVSGTLSCGSGLAHRWVCPTRCARCAGGRSAAPALGVAACSRSGSTRCRSQSRASLRVRGHDSAGGSPAGRSSCTVGPQWSVVECLSWLLSRLGLSTPSRCQRSAGTPSDRSARQVSRLLRLRAASSWVSLRATCRPVAPLAR